MKYIIDDYFKRPVIALFLIIYNSMLYANPGAVANASGYIDPSLKYAFDSSNYLADSKLLNNEFIGDLLVNRLLEGSMGCKMISDQKERLNGLYDLIGYPASVGLTDVHRFQLVIRSILFPADYINNVSNTFSEILLKTKILFSKFGDLKSGEWILLLVGLGLILIQISRESHKRQSSYLRSFEQIR